ncbi:hypothetical protein LCGC14_2616860, partial [marine sediment metagenome]
MIQTSAQPTKVEISKVMAAMGRKGGLKGGKKGGKVRAENMTPEERSESARKAVQARWAKAKKAK